MADEQMLDHRLQRRRKSFDRVHRLTDRFHFHNDVAQKLALRRVTNGAVVAKFVELANVVQYGYGQEQVRIELGIMIGCQLRQAAKTDDVFEQTTEVSVMHYFCGRSTLVTRGGRGVAQDSVDQFF